MTAVSKIKKHKVNDKPKSIADLRKLQKEMAMKEVESPSEEVMPGEEDDKGEDPNGKNKDSAKKVKPMLSIHVFGK